MSGFGHQLVYQSPLDEKWIVSAVVTDDYKTLLLSIGDSCDPVNRWKDKRWFRYTTERTVTHVNPRRSHAKQMTRLIRLSMSHALYFGALIFAVKRYMVIERMTMKIFERIPTVVFFCCLSV